MTYLASSSKVMRGVLCPLASRLSSHGYKTGIPKSNPHATELRDPSTYPILENDAYAHHGRNIILKHLSTKYPGHETMHLPLPRPLPPITGKATGTLPIGILGGGAGGLYTALILQDLGIPYRILEASDRLGGRLFTYKFPNETGSPDNYYDVGAMRFPETPFMRRVFELFRYRPFNGELEKKLQKYYFIARDNNTFLDYNGVTKRRNESLEPDTFKPSAVITSTQKKRYIAAGYDAIVNDVITPFAKGIFDDLHNHTTEGWEEMMRHEDYSTRAYMSLAYRPSVSLNLPPAHLPTDVVNWCETFDKSTGWYDRSLSETVLEAIAFGWTPDPGPRSIDWWCIRGGVEEISKCIKNYLLECNNNPDDLIMLNSRVTSVGLNDSTMEVVTANATTHKFSHVISTLPLGVLRTIDLAGAKLCPLQSNALRELTYGPATKVGLQFQTAWWTNDVIPGQKPLNIVGGQSYTDRPVRTIVYPSFGKVEQGKTTTLIASYSWTDDALRLGALVGKADEVLKDRVLRDLAAIHGVSLDFLYKQLIDYHAWSWSQDPLTVGAFAFFGPGKFESLYTSLTKPAAKGRLHFAGEAISVRHAWVEGALDSAWRAVSELLHLPGWQHHLEKFHKNWGVNSEWVARKVDQPMSRDGRIDPEADLILKQVYLSNPDLFEQ